MRGGVLFFDCRFLNDGCINKRKILFMLTYQRIVTILILIVLLLFSLGCASSIVDGEYIRTSPTKLTSKPPNANIEIYFSDKSPPYKWHEIGKIVIRAYVLEKGIERLKQEARKLGADAVINVKYERKLSVDYLQDLYFIIGDAVVWDTSG
jgi:hypothetical protein